MSFAVSYLPQGGVALRVNESAAIFSSRADAAKFLRQVASGIEQNEQLNGKLVKRAWWRRWWRA